MAEDVFTTIGKLYTKGEIAEVPASFFIVHRFLVSLDPQYAKVARYLQRDFGGDTKRILAFWRSYLPKARKAPRTPYTGPQSGKDIFRAKFDTLDPREKLAVRIARDAPERREVVERMISFVEGRGRLDELMYEYGIDPEGEDR